MPHVDAEERLSSAQIGIISNSVTYNKTEVERTVRILSDLASESQPKPRRTLSPEMVRELMGIEIEYKSA